MEHTKDVTKPAGAASELTDALERLAALEKRVAQLEAAQKANRPAMQAAWMHVPIGGVLNR